MVLYEAVQIRISKWMFDSIRFGADSFWNLIDSLDSWILVDSGGFEWILVDSGLGSAVDSGVDSNGYSWVFVDSGRF